MSVAVVIPVRNGMPWVFQALDTVFAQSLRPAEVVVVDDRSTDGAPETLARMDAIRLVSGPGEGPGPARARGVLACSAPLIAFLDHDDLWHPGHLEILEAALQKRPEAGAVAAGCAPFTGPRPPELRDQPFDPVDLDVWEHFPALCPVWTASCAMVRRTALEEAGGWQGRITAMDDFHLWLRLSVHRPFLSVGAPTVGWRHRGESVSSVLRGDAVRCLSKHHDVARAGLEYRDQQGGDMEPYRRRCAGFRHLADLAAAMVDPEAEGIAAAACALEVATQPDPDTYIERLFHQLFWVFCQSVDPRRRRRFQQETCAQLAACWPADAPRTSAALRRLGRRRRWWRRGA